MFFLFIILQTGIVGLPIVQIVNYIMLIINALYTLVFSVFVAPTYRDHKAMMKDYNDRMAPATVELRELEKKRLAKCENDCAEIKHNLNNLTNQLSPVLKKLENEPDLTEVLKAIQELNKKL